MLSLLLEESEPHVKQIFTDPDTFGTTTIMIFPFFEFVKQIFTDPDTFGTTTIPAYQGPFFELHLYFSP